MLILYYYVDSYTNCTYKLSHISACLRLLGESVSKLYQNFILFAVWFGFCIWFLWCFICCCIICFTYSYTFKSCFSCNRFGSGFRFKSFSGSGCWFLARKRFLLLLWNQIFCACSLAHYCSCLSYVCVYLLWACVCIYLRINKKLQKQ